MIGKMDRRCRFERRTGIVNDYGEPGGDWAHVATVWGWKKETTGAEAIRAGAVGEVATATLHIWDSPQSRAFAPDMRCVIDGAPWNVVSIHEVPGPRRRVLGVLLRRGEGI